MNQRLVAASAVVTCLLFFGCAPKGPELGEVTGTVKLDGKVVPNARIEFQPVAEGGSPSMAYTNEDGTYELKYTDRNGALIGEHEVRISTFRQIPTDEGGGVVPEMFPPKYNDKTGLTRTVEKGANVIDFDLPSR